MSKKRPGVSLRRGPALVAMAKDRPQLGSVQTDETAAARVAISGARAAEQLAERNRPKGLNGEPLDLDKLRDKLGE